MHLCSKAAITLRTPSKVSKQRRCCSPETVHDRAGRCYDQNVSFRLPCYIWTGWFVWVGLIALPVSLLQEFASICWLHPGLPICIWLSKVNLDDWHMFWRLHHLTCLVQLVTSCCRVIQESLVPESAPCKGRALNLWDVDRRSKELMRPRKCKHQNHQSHWSL